MARNIAKALRFFTWYWFPMSTAATNNLAREDAISIDAGDHVCDIALAWSFRSKCRTTALFLGRREGRLPSTSGSAPAQLRRYFH